MDGPPSVLLILPFGAQPTIVEVPHNASNRTTMTGNYTLNKFPLKSGTQFIVSMLYGDDRDGGNVSVVQTVGDSPDSNCLSTEAPSLHSFFTLDPPVPSQCSSQTVSWDSSLYPQPPEIRAFIPGGDAIYFDPPASKGATQLAWRVNVREGAQMVLLIRPIALGQWEGNSRTSPLMVVTGKSNDVPDCLVISDENKSTVTLESVTATSSIFESTTVFPEPEGSERAKSVNIPAIIGGIAGGLGVIGIICAAIAVYRSSTREIEVSPFENLGTHMVPRSGFVYANSMHKSSLGTRVDGRAGHVPTVNGKHTKPAYTIRRTRSGPSPGERVREGVSSSARRPTSPGPAPSAIPTGRDIYEDDEDNRHRLDTRRWTDGVAGIRRIRENLIRTAYFTHTDAGAVRLVELPPSYNGLQVQSMDRE